MLTIRTENALIFGLKTDKITPQFIAQTCKNPRQLLHLDNFGKRSLEELKAWMADAGYVLSEDNGWAKPTDEVDSGVHKCTCRVCSDHRRWMGAINPQTDGARAALDEILTRLEAAETDSAYWELKFRGKWPPDQVSEK